MKAIHKVFLPRIAMASGEQLEEKANKQGKLDETFARGPRRGTFYLDGHLYDSKGRHIQGEDSKGDRGATRASASQQERHKAIAGSAAKAAYTAERRSNWTEAERQANWDALG